MAPAGKNLPESGVLGSRYDQDPEAWGCSEPLAPILKVYNGLIVAKDSELGAHSRGS